MTQPASGADHSFDASTGRLFAGLVARSEGTDGYLHLSQSPKTGRWVGGLLAQLPRRFSVHCDEPARMAARLAHAEAFVLDDRIFLGDVPIERLEHVLRHELVHLAQLQLARCSGRAASPDIVEREAIEVSGLPIATPVQHGAHPLHMHRFVWFIAIGVGGYILLRPSVANAPGPGDATIASPSAAQIMAEAICLFAIPGGAFALGGRIGLGFLGRSALAGASATVSMRGVDDAARGQLSHPLLYVFDAATGAVIGFVVPGGFRLIGRAGTQSLDRLATYGMRTSDIAATRLLAEHAARTPLTAEQARIILQSRGMAGQVSHWWLERRGVVVLYRGQEQVTQNILSPLARQEGVAASQELVLRMRTLGLSDREIAGYTARWHSNRVPPFAAPSGMAWQPLGAVGIPTTRVPGIAANFARQGTIYVIRVPQNAAIPPQGWQGLALEHEFIILNQVPPGSVVQAIPASRVAPLMVNESGLLVPGRP